MGAGVTRLPSGAVVGAGDIIAFGAVILPGAIIGEAIVAGFIMEPGDIIDPEPIEPFMRLWRFIMPDCPFIIEPLESGIMPPFAMRMRNAIARLWHIYLPCFVLP